MIVLTDSIKRDIDNAFVEAHPIIVCGVTPEGEPTVSYRGTAQAFGDGAIAFWVRRTDDSSLLASIEAHPVVVLIYSNMPARRHYQFRGRARRADDEATRAQVYEGSHQFERAQDPDRKGVAVVVNLTSVRGRGEDGPVNLKAE